MSRYTVHTVQITIYTSNVQLYFIRRTVQITFIFIDFRVCDFAFAFKTQNFNRILFSDRFQFAF